MEAKVRDYNVKGRLVHIEKMRNLILDALDNRSLTIAELSKEMGMEHRRVQYVVLKMKNLGMLDSTKREQQGQDKIYKYFKPQINLLQEILHPMPDFSDRIKSIYIHTEEEANAHR
jgi:DNA-binding transcriptional ArsR family regulator